MSFETTLEQPIPDGRAEGDLSCMQGDCVEDATTWCPLCEKLLCAEHDELAPRRMHDCLAEAADD